MISASTLGTLNTVTILAHFNESTVMYMSQSAPIIAPIDVRASVEEYFQRCYREYPDQYYFALRGSQLSSMLGLTATSALSYHEVENLHEMTLDLEGDIFAPTRGCAVLVVPTPNERDGFKVYGIVRRPKVLEAIIQLGVEMIQWHMNAEDVDAPPVEITFLVTDVYEVWYDKHTRATYDRYIAKAITERLGCGETRIVATWKEEDGIFECRRI